MNLVPYIPLVLKAIVGVNVKEEMASRNDVIDRPFFFSGRFIGTIMTLVFGSYAAKVGYDLNASIETVTELVNLIYDNEKLRVAIGGMVVGIVRGILGVIQKR
jgi:hypothetical protein